MKKILLSLLLVVGFANAGEYISNVVNPMDLSNCTQGQEPIDLYVQDRMIYNGKRGYIFKIITPDNEVECHVTAGSVRYSGSYGRIAKPELIEFKSIAMINNLTAMGIKNNSIIYVNRPGKLYTGFNGSERVLDVLDDSVTAFDNHRKFGIYYTEFDSDKPYIYFKDKKRYLKLHTTDDTEFTGIADMQIIDRKVAYVLQLTKNKDGKLVNYVTRYRIENNEFTYSESVLITNTDKVYEKMSIVHDYTNGIDAFMIRKDQGMDAASIDYIQIGYRTKLKSKRK